MTRARTNLAGITSAELLSKLLAGESFFVETQWPAITRVLITQLKTQHNLEVETTQAVGGLWIKPTKSE
jgi:hypothetical protein